MSNSTNKDIKGLYVMAFTPDAWGPDKLKEVGKIADGMLRDKDATFKQMMESDMAPNTRLDLTSVQYAPFMNTPEWMQTMFMGWLKKKNVDFKPVPGKNLFTHGMKDPDGKEVIFFFYFEMAEDNAGRAIQQETANTVQERIKPETPATKKSSKWIIIAAVVGVVILCVCLAITILPVIIFGGS